ncbi:sensor histidine kinase [Endothiovibrio diazotrophicus]
MARLSLPFILLLLTLAGPAPAAGGAVVLDGTAGRWTFGAALVGRVSEHPLDYAEAARQTFAPLPQATDAGLYVGFDRRDHWFRVELEVPRPLGTLYLQQPWFTQRLEAYLERPDGTLASASASSLQPFAQRPVAAPDLVLPLAFDQAGRYLLTFRVRSSQLLLLDLSLWQPQAYYAEQVSRTRIGSALIGIHLFIVLFTVMLAWVARQHFYFWFAAAATVNLFSVVAVEGLGGQYLWPDSPLWGSYSVALTRMVSLMLLIRFVAEFLEAASRAPAFRRFGCWLVWALLLTGAALPFIGIGVAHRLMGIAWLLYLGAAVVVALRLHRQGFRETRFLLFAVLLWIAALLLNSLLLFGHSPALDLFRLAEGLLATSFLFFAVALADRMNYFRRQLLESQQALLAEEQRHALELEGNVKRRTRELLAANEAKDKLYSIIAHDLRGPIGWLTTVFGELVEEGAVLERELFLAIRQTTRKSFALLEELLSWSRSPSGAIEARPTVFPVAAAVEECRTLLQAQLDQKGLRFQGLDPACELRAYADRAMATTVLRNLVSNAAKFTPRGGAIAVTATADGGELRLEVADTGVGMSTEAMARMFAIEGRIHTSRGTDGEVGSGLGLLLCKEFVEKNGGTIGVESRLGEGSRLWFTLPAADGVEFATAGAVPGE